VPGLVSPAPTKSLKGPCTLGTFETCQPARKLAAFREDRKRAAHGQTDANDPGCVKTCGHEERAELFSLLSCPRQLSPALLFFRLIEVETKFPFANSISAFSRSQDPTATSAAPLQPPSRTGLSPYQGNRSDPKDAVSWAMDGRRLFVPFSLRSFGP
jgi:hypothetical protein